MAGKKSSEKGPSFLLLELAMTDKERLERIARERGLSEKMAALLAFTNGLAILNGKPAAALPVQQPTSRLTRQGLRQNLEDFIKAKWQELSDEEIAIQLGYSPITIRVKRLALGLKRPRGSRGPGRSPIGPTGLRPETLARYQQVDEFIRKNWGKMADPEMASQCECSPGFIRSRRLVLGLKRSIGPSLKLATEEEIKFLRENYLTMSNGDLARHFGCSPATIAQRLRDKGLKRHGKIGEAALGSLKTKISEEELRRALLEDGFKFSDLAKKHQVSRQRIQQLADEYGIRVRKQRTPRWHAIEAGNEQLADKNWLEEQLREKGGAWALASTLGINPSFLQNQAERLGIDLKELRQHGELVELTCSTCGQMIRRPKQLIRNPHQKNFFCNRTCQGKWLGQHRGLVVSGLIKLWTEKEEQFLQKNFQKMSDKELGKALERTPIAVGLRRRLLGLLRQHK